MKLAARGLVLLGLLLLLVATPSFAALGILPPTAITVYDDSPGQITVSWVPSTYGGPYDYQLRRSTDSSRGSTKTILLDWSPNLSYANNATNSGANTPEPGRPYYYWLVTRNQGDDQALTTGQYVMQGPYKGVTAMPAPTGVTATDGTSAQDVTITWTPVPAPAGTVYLYRVYRSTSLTGTKTALTDWTDGMVSLSEWSATPLATYYYWVKVKNAYTESDYGGPDAGWRALAAPTNVMASDGIYTDRILVTWTGVLGATAYRVYRSDSPTGIIELIGVTSSTSFSDTSATRLVPLYYYWVLATTAYGASVASTPDTGYLRLAGVSGVVASDGLYADRVEVTWNPVTGPVEYRVYRGLTQLGTKTALGNWIVGLTFNDTAALPGVIYYYFMQARDIRGQTSDYSPPDTGWRMMQAPTGVAATDGDYTDRVRITWDLLPGAEEYQVYRAILPTDPPIAIGPWVVSTFFDDTEGFPLQVYNYWVRGRNSSVQSPLSTPDTGFKSLPAPQPPANVSATDGTDVIKVVVTWTASVGANEFRVYRSTINDPNTAVPLGTDWQSGTIFEDLTAAQGTVYFYWVLAQNNNGQSAFGASDSGFLAPVDVTGITASDGTFSEYAQVDWNAYAGPPPATEYRVSRSDTADGLRTPLGVWFFGTTFQDTTGVAEQVYFYWVEAREFDGTPHYSFYDTGFRRLGPPSSVQATDGVYTDRVTVTWGAVPGAIEYRVFRTETLNGPLTALGNWQFGTLFLDTTAVPMFRYFYYVKARTPYGESGVSGYDIGWRALAPPTAVTATDGTSAANTTVTWTAEPQATEYRVFRTETPDGPKTPVSNWVTTTTAPDVTGIPLKRYYYFVRGRSGYGESDYSGYDVGFRLMSAPTGCAATDGIHDDRIRVTCNPVGGATQYRFSRADCDPAAGYPSWWYPITGWSPITEFVDPYVIRGFIYYYRSEARNDYGQSAPSAYDFGFSALPAPVGVAAFPAGGIVVATWNPVPAYLFDPPPDMITDNLDGAPYVSRSGRWNTSAADAYDDPYFGHSWAAGTWPDQPNNEPVHTWWPYYPLDPTIGIPVSGRYVVYAWWTTTDPPDGGRASDAQYTISYNAGRSTRTTAVAQSVDLTSTAPPDPLDDFAGISPPLMFWYLDNDFSTQFVRLNKGSDVNQVPDPNEPPDPGLQLPRVPQHEEWLCADAVGFRFSEATAYSVYRSTTENGSREYLGSTPFTFWIDGTGVPGQEYFYWIVAVDNYDDSVYSLYARAVYPSTLPPTLTITPLQTPPGDFGTVQVGHYFDDDAFRLTNTGQSVIHGTVSVDPPFYVLSNASFALGEGDSVLVRMRFAPIVSGTFTNRVSFLTDAGNQYQDVTGIGQGAVLQVLPNADLAFGNVGIGGSKTLLDAYEVVNTGGGTLNLHVFVAPPFYILDDAGNPLSERFISLARDQRVMLDFRCSPPATAGPGAIAEQITFATNGGTVYHNATANLIGPVLEVTPADVAGTDLDFGDVKVNTTRELNAAFSIRNAGGGTLTGIVTVDETPQPVPADQISVVSGGVFNLGPGLSQTIRVMFAPVVLGVDLADLVFTSNAGVQTRQGSGNSIVDPIIDNRDPNTASTGTWTVSPAPRAWSIDSVVASDPAATFRWIPYLEVEGYYDVYAWWTYAPTRSTSVTYSIIHKDGTSTVTVNQRDPALPGQWNYLGRFPFDQGSQGYIQVQATNGETCADAVRLVGAGPLPPGRPRITSPLVANGVVGKPFSYSLTASGTPPIAFDVEDNLPLGLAFAVNQIAGVPVVAGRFEIALSATNAVGSDIQVLVLTITVNDIIVDNRDLNTLRIGSWRISTAKPPWAQDSFQSRKKSCRFRWIPTLPAPGYYAVSAWWTSAKSRTTGAVYRTYHAEGMDAVVVNQRINGGRWNPLGTYPFEAGATGFVELSGQKGQVCADAIKFVYVGPLDDPALSLPSPYILVTPDQGPAPLQVQVAAIGLPAGASAKWDFGDRTKGAGQTLTHTYHSPGTYTIWLTAAGITRKATVVVTEK